MRIFRVLVQTLFYNLLGLNAFAAAPTFSVDGVVSKPDGSALEESGVIFTVDVRAPASAESCLLYREYFNVDMTGSGGYFSIPVGKGSNTAGGSYSLSQVFSSGLTMSGLNECTLAGTTYTPAPNEDRQIVISFTDTGGAHVFSAQNLEAVPFAIQAKSAENVGGYSSNQILKADGLVDQSTNPNAALSQSQYDEFWRLIKNPGAAYLTPAALGSSALSGDVTGTLGSALSVDKIKGNAVASGVPIDGQVLSWSTANSRWEPATPATSSLPGLSDGKVWIGNGINAATAVPVTGDATLDNTGVLTIGAGKVNNAKIAAGVDAAKISAGNVSNTEFDYLDGVTSAIQGQLDVMLKKTGDTMTGNLNMGGNKITNLKNVPNVAADPTVSENGKTLRWNDGTTSWEWFTAAAAGAGIMSLGGQTGSSQNFAINTVSGASPAWASSTNTHTLTIPMASAPGVAAGLISKTDYDSFTAKLTSPLTTKGDLITSDGTNNVRLPAGTNNYVLTADAAQASGLKWAAIPGLPSIADKTLLANTSGVAAAPVSTTLTAIVDSALGNTQGSVLYRNGTAWTVLTPGTSGQFLQTSGAGADPVWGSPAAIADATTSSKGIMRVGSGLAVSSGTVSADSTTSGAANKLLMLDGTGVGSVKGLDIQTGAGKVTLQTNGIFTNYVLTLPADDGNLDQVLKTDGNGLLSWTTPSTTDNTKLPLSGGTMTGSIAMGSGNITATALNTGGTITGTNITGTIITGKSGINIQTSGGPGSMQLRYPATPLNRTITFPTSLSTVGQVLTATDSNGTVEWQTPSTNATSIAGFPVSLFAPINGDVLTWDGINWIAGSADNGESANIPDTIVRRDGTGAFEIGIVKAFDLALKDASSNVVSLRAESTTSNYILRVPATAPTLSQVLMTNNITGGNDVHTEWKSASSIVSPNNLVMWDGSGNLGANSITLTGGALIEAKGAGRVEIRGLSTGSFNVSASSVIDFANANTVRTSFDCASVLTLSNMLSGGHYTLLVSGTGTNTCNFNSSGDSFKFAASNPNGTRTASSQTIYEFTKIDTTVFVRWTTGYPP